MKNRIKQYRAKNNFTQSDLAERVQVSRQTIHAIESGKYIPSTLLALKLSAVFKVPVNELFELEEKDWRLNK